MKTAYYLVYKNPSGGTGRVLQHTDWMRMEFVKKEREIGSLYLDLPGDFPSNYFQIDGRFEVYRVVGAHSPKLECDSVWLIRLIRYKTDNNGEKILHVLAHDAIELLD